MSIMNNEFSYNDISICYNENRICYNDILICYNEKWICLNEIVNESSVKDCPSPANTDEQGAVKG